MPNDNPIPRLIRLDEVTRLTSLRRSAIFERIATGEFPKLVALSSRCVAWKLDEICRWIESQRALSVIDCESSAIVAAWRGRARLRL